MGIRVVISKGLVSACVATAALLLLGCGAPDAAPLPVEVAPDHPYIAITG